jgi:hypothetical protein
MRMRLISCAVIILGLAGCQAFPGGNRDGAGPAAGAISPIAGGEIAVTSLDAPAPAAVAAAPGSGAPGASENEDPAPLAPVPDKMPDASPAATQAADVPAAAEPVAPVVIKSAAHLACEKRGGRWSVAGGGSAAFCQTPTKDAGKSCRKSGDCSGYCLEKSRTCAPVTPMLGCHDILNETGRMLTQCIN